MAKSREMAIATNNGAGTKAPLTGKTAQSASQDPCPKRNKDHLLFVEAATFFRSNGPIARIQVSVQFPKGVTIGRSTGIIPEKLQRTE